MLTTVQPTISSVGTNDDGLTVDWDNGESSFFHYVWLRDCCYCDECGDCHSSLRRYVPGLETLGVRPSSVSWDSSGLTVEWNGNHHRSTYPAAWLNTHRYDDRARAARRQPVTLWDASSDIDGMSFAFDSVNADPRERLALHRQLIASGVAIIRDGPRQPDGVLSFAGLFGEVAQSAYGAVFDLTPGNAVGTAGTTLRGVPPHSDEAFVYSPPGIEILACIRPAEDGGDSILVDGFGIATKLRQAYPGSFEMLANWNHHFVRLHDGKLDQRASAPVIALDDDGEISGIRLHTRASAPLDLPESVMEDYLTAYHRLCALMMSAENQVRLQLDSGDAIVFDNHRALHARGEFSDRRRHLQICGVTREKFHESFRLLATRLGDTESANLVLRAGACR